MLFFSSFKKLCVCINQHTLLLWNKFIRLETFMYITNISSWLNEWSYWLLYWICSLTRTIPCACLIPSAGKYRFLLRREQVHKIACNHLLTPDLNVTSMNTSETAWCWTAQDFSEGEMKVEQLAVKFKVSSITCICYWNVEQIHRVMHVPSGAL